MLLKILIALTIYVLFILKVSLWFQEEENNDEKRIRNMML